MSNQEQSTPPAPAPRRHPLGLPRGSVRALLAMSIFGMTMGILILGYEIDRDLWMVNSVILGYYFGSRQNSGQVGEQEGHHPLRLPKGAVRWLLLLTFLGTAGYFIYIWRVGEDLPDHFEENSLYPLITLGAFFLGRIVRFIMSPLKKRGIGLTILSDIKAMFALLCAGCLILLFITDWSFEGIPFIQELAMSFTIFYFGSR